MVVRRSENNKYVFYSITHSRWSLGTEHNESITQTNIVPVSGLQKFEILKIKFNKMLNAVTANPVKLVTPLKTIHILSINCNLHRFEYPPSCRTNAIQ